MSPRGESIKSADACSFLHFHVLLAVAMMDESPINVPARPRASAMGICNCFAGCTYIGIGSTKCKLQRNDFRNRRRLFNGVPFGFSIDHEVRVR